MLILPSEDGGGIRAYSSLLILRALMKMIAQLENATLRSATQHNNDDTLINSIDGNLPLPCHYFDYIFGSSTGGYYADLGGVI